jgi:hypothetical protein
MEALQIFSYNEAPVSFKNENGVVYVSATEMEKPFGKRATDWLRTQTSQSFIRELSKVRNHTLAELVEVVKGGSNPGTWMHEDVAIEFSRWLSPSFAIWCNDRIKELMRYGVTSTDKLMEQMLSNPDAMINALSALKAEREEKQRLLEQTQMQKLQLVQSAPKAEYYDNVLQSTETYATTRIAIELGVSAIAMNKKLQEKRVQRKVMILPKNRT